MTRANSLSTSLFRAFSFLLALSFLISSLLPQEFLKLLFAAMVTASPPIIQLLCATVVIVPICSPHDKSDLQARKATCRQSFIGLNVVTSGHSRGGYHQMYLKSKPNSLVLKPKGDVAWVWHANEAPKCASSHSTASNSTNHKPHIRTNHRSPHTLHTNFLLNPIG